MERFPRGRDELIAEILRLSGALQTKTTIVTIGGTPMVLRGQKPATADIDIIAFTAADKDHLIQCLRKIGYSRKMGVRFQNPVTKFWVDIDVRKFLKIPLTDRMVKRAERRLFGNLSLLIISNEDNILFKCMGTGRRHLEDIRDIIKTSRIHWKTVRDEAEKLTVEALRREKPFPYPQRVLARLKTVNTEFGLIDNATLSTFENLATK